MKYFKSFFQRGMDFTGTTGRSEYWYTILSLVIGGFVVGLVGGFFYGFFGVMVEKEVLDAVFIGLGIVLAVVAIVCNISLTVRRIRDLGISGWFYLLFFAVGLIPYLGLVLQIIPLCLKTNALKSDIV